ncbi:MAG: DUF6316 family protein [Pseudomonas sp.]|uniref:DUF6316 family protein n=1 Tax=Pseudomonas abieticivorans TaxID=2931382 RepID=UPI0020C0D644|nr:DUF6316 family protein [Pseudomonas sp. PIA16]MDE1164263.1 DUF6316 family protein [Pseudomonas sp.]
MFGKRAQDQAPSTHFRSDRVTRENGLFFFVTRERTQEGPYDSREEAERGCDQYVERMRKRA